MESCSLSSSVKSQQPMCSSTVCPSNLLTSLMDSRSLACYYSHSSRYGGWCFFSPGPLSCCQQGPQICVIKQLGGAEWPQGCFVSLCALHHRRWPYQFCSGVCSKPSAQQSSGLPYCGNGKDTFLPLGWHCVRCVLRQGCLGPKGVESLGRDF